MKRHTSSSSLSKGFNESRIYEVFEPEQVDVPVRIRSSDREEKFCILHIAISMNNVSGTHHQVLVIEVTDDTDPFFLYALECGESEFHTLKKEQAILVDFLTFPHKLIELLQMCTKKLEDSPKFICNLEKGSGFEGTLNICENNLFRQITHLSLRLRSGSDEIIKKHLAGKLKEYKNLCENLETRLSQTEESLMLKNAEYSDTVRQFEILSTEFERKVEETKLMWQEKMNTMKQQMIDSQQRSTQMLEQEKRISFEKLERQLDEMTRKFDHVQSQLHDLSAEKYSVEGREKELSLKYKQLQHELELSTNELQHLRKANKSLDTNMFDQEKSLTEYRLKVQSLERQLQDKEELNQKLSTLVQTNSEFKGQQEDTLSLLKATISKLEDKLQQSASEINKGNSIIQKLQSDVKSGKQKLKLKNSVVLQQENVIQQKSELCDNLDKQIYQLKRETDKKDEQVRGLERLVNDLKTKLEENHKALDSNVQTIQYLNNRITEMERAKMPYSSTYKPTTNPNTVAFRPSPHLTEHLMTTTPRLSSHSSLPEANEHLRTRISSSIPDSDPLTSFLNPANPIKFKEPNP